MVVGMIVLTSLLLLALPFIYQIMSEQKLSEKSYKFIAAMSLAEAGAERAIWEMSYGNISTWDGDNTLRTKNIPGFQAAGGNVMGDIEIAVEQPEDDYPVVEATGMVPLSAGHTLDKTVQVVLERQRFRPFDFGLFGNIGVFLNSNALVNSYDSRQGSYGGDNIKWNGHVGTNATYVGCVNLESNAKIYGNGVSGPGSNPEQVITLKSSARIYGSKQALDESKDLNSLTVPVGLPYRGSYSLGGGQSDTISTSGMYSSLMLGKKAVLTIAGEVTLYVTNLVSLGDECRINVAAGAALKLYIGGTFSQAGDMRMNNVSEDPTKLLILGVDNFTADFVWNSNDAFYGGIYVPRSRVFLNSNIDFYGSIIAKQVFLESNARIHYDEALAEVELDVQGLSPLYIVKSWQQKIQ